MGLAGGGMAWHEGQVEPAEEGGVRTLVVASLFSFVGGCGKKLYATPSHRHEV
jgi:hypothetical protein